MVSCTDHDERSEGRNKHFFLAQKRGMASEPEEGTGHPCHGRRFRVWRWEQAVVQCLGDEWVKVAQNNTVRRSKLEENDKLEKKRKMIDRTCVEIE